MRRPGPAWALAFLALVASAGQAALGIPDVAAPKLWSTDLDLGSDPGVATGPLGDTFLAGTVRGETKVWKLDALGEPVWEARVAGLAAGVAALPEGGAVVVSTVWGDGPDVLVTWLGPQGHQDAARVVSTPSAWGFVADLARGVAASPQGVFVAGSAGAGLLAARFDLDGTPRWTRWLPMQREAVAEAVAVGVDGLPVFAGWTYDGTRNNLTLLKLDDHGQLYPKGWVRQLAGPLGASLRAHALGAAPTGFLVVAGVQDEGPRRYPFAAGFDRNGELRWRRALTLEPGAELRAAAADAAGGALVAGTAPGAGGHGDWFLARFTGTGALAWSKRFDTGGDDHAQGLAWHPSGLLTVGGSGAGALVAARYADTPIRP